MTRPGASLRIHRGPRWLETGLLDHLPIPLQPRARRLTPRHDHLSRTGGPVRHTLVATLVASLLSLATHALAQGSSPAHAEGGLDAETLKKANDPMADTKAFNLQNYNVSSAYGSEVKSNQLLFRYAQPAGKFLIRATLPLVTVAPPDAAPVSGFGDFNVFAIYTLPSSPGNKFG